MITHDRPQGRRARYQDDLPIDRLRELAAEGIIEGVSDKHLGFGFTQNLRDLYERSPRMAKILFGSKVMM